MKNKRRSKSASASTGNGRDPKRPSRMGLKVIILLAATALFAAAIVSFVPITTAQRNSEDKLPDRTVKALPRTISQHALQQMSELADEKRSRTPAQKKIDSHLLYEAKMRRGEAITKSVPTLRRSIKVDARERTEVNIVIRNRKSVLVDLEKLGIKYGKANEPEIINAIGKDIFTNVRIDQIEEIASWPDVISVRPKPIYKTQRQSAGRVRASSLFLSGPLDLGSMLFGNAGLNVLSRAERIRRQVSDQLASLYKTTETGSVNSPLAANVSQGDKTHKADFARALYQVNGTGVKVGVLSDGVDSLAALQGTGDLGPVTVLPGQAGSGDEGSAMLEIVHDLAPGAQLFFATADPTQAQFAQNIRDLRTAGCDIIIDDVVYFAESPFHDGQVAPVTSPDNGGLIEQAVNDVTAAGAMYFSSAGNEGNKDDATSSTWEGDFVPNGTPAKLAGGGPANNFGDGGQSVLMNFAGTPVLWWTDPLGTSANDYDLYDMSGDLNSVFDASTNTQDGVGGDDDPFEIISGGSFGGERLVVTQFAGSGRFLHLANIGGDLAISTSGAIFGHAQAANAFAVAATPAAAGYDVGQPSGPYPNAFTGANVSETFTSDGPRHLYFNPNGSLTGTAGNFSSTGGVVRQKPDITAADGVSCAAPTFDPFFGTSAAAPHAGAIAALVKSSNLALTPAQIRTALNASAIDIEAVGIDLDTGKGIVMADAALNAVGATPHAIISTAATTVIGEGCLPANGALDPNEVDTVSFCVTNTGGASTTAALTGTLQTTGGVTLAGPAAVNFGVIAQGATVCRNFTFKSNGTCAAPLTASIQFQDGATDMGTVTYPFRLGAAAAPGAPQTFSYTGPVVPIPDGLDASGTNPGLPANATLNVSGVPGVINDLNFSFDGTACSATAGSTTVGLDHTFVSDLHIKLTSPSATSVDLIIETDTSGNNFCQTVLDDDTANPSIQTVVAANAPFTGTFKPNSPLSAFDFQNPNGIWTLTAQDFAAADTGNIRAFSLIITPQVFTCNACTTAAGVSIGGRVTTPDGNGLRNANVVFTNSHGIARTVMTNSFGYYQFDDVQPGDTYIIGVSAKHYIFASRALQVTDTLADVNFVGDE